MRVGKRAPVPCFCIPFAALGRLYNPIDLPNPPAPPELPKPLKYRKRALSNDFKGSSNAQLMKMARSQKDSWLFDLPPELRNQIWKACLGGLKLHFELQMNLLRQSTWGPSGERRKNGLLSLPLTCRRTYLETISILYGYNTIQLRTPNCVMYLNRLLLPQRINEIRTLHLHWYVAAPPSADTVEYQDWRKAWRSIASMEGLAHLRVELDTVSQRQHQWSCEESRLLEDVKLVTRPQKFELSLSWPTPQGGVPLQLPCEISRITGIL